MTTLSAKPKRVHTVPHHNKGKGKAYQWLLDHIQHQGEECLTWPFYVDPSTGRGHLGHNGESYKAHRLMCLLAKGKPPTPLHQAAHNCGKGHEACVHPAHLEWKTGSDNQRDRAKHGTKAHNIYGWKGKVSREEVAQIRGLKGIKTLREAADMFGVSETTIGDIQRGRTWRELGQRG